MSIFDLLKEHESKKRYHTDKDEAMVAFVKQKQSLDAIKHTKGFKEIRDYWMRVVLACNERLRTIRSEDIKRCQGELDQAMEFLNFLDSILAEELSKEDLDILNS
jgi:hypothetical protein